MRQVTFLPRHRHARVVCLQFVFTTSETSYGCLSIPKMRELKAAGFMIPALR